MPKKATLAPTTTNMSGNTRDMKNIIPGDICFDDDDDILIILHSQNLLFDT